MPVTVNVLCRFVCVVLHNHLNEVHALNNEPFKGDPLPYRGEHVADSKFQGALDQGDEWIRVGLQEIQQLRQVGRRVEREDK